MEPKEQDITIANLKAHIKILEADIAACRRTVAALERQVDQLKLSNITNVFYTA